MSKMEMLLRDELEYILENTIEEGEVSEELKRDIVGNVIDKVYRLVDNILEEELYKTLEEENN